MDCNSLAIDGVERCPRLQKIGTHFIEKMREKQFECRQYAYEYGIDAPEVDNWCWPFDRQVDE